MALPRLGALLLIPERRLSSSKARVGRSSSRRPKHPLAIATRPPDTLLLTTARHYAAEYGLLEVVEVLLGHGANPRAVGFSTGAKPKPLTPLHSAVTENNFRGTARIVAALLEAGADEHAKDERGMTPLALAQGTAAPAVLAALQRHEFAELACTKQEEVRRHGASDLLDPLLGSIDLIDEISARSVQVDATKRAKKRAAEAEKAAAAKAAAKAPAAASKPKAKAKPAAAASVAASPRSAAEEEVLEKQRAREREQREKERVEAREAALEEAVCAFCLRGSWSKTAPHCPPPEPASRLQAALPR